MPRHSRESEQAVRRFLRDHDAELYGYGMSHKQVIRAVRLHTEIQVSAKYLRTLRALEPGLRWSGHAGSIDQSDKPLTGAQWNALLLWIGHHATDQELQPGFTSQGRGNDLALARRIAAAGIGVRPSLGNIHEAMRLVRDGRLRNRLKSDRQNAEQHQLNEVKL